MFKEHNELNNRGGKLEGVASEQCDVKIKVGQTILQQSMTDLKCRERTPIPRGGGGGSEGGRC